MAFISFIYFIYINVVRVYKCNDTTNLFHSKRNFKRLKNTSSQILFINYIIV